MRFIRAIFPLVTCLSLPGSTLGSIRSALTEKASLKDKDKKSGFVEGQRLLDLTEGEEANGDEMLVIAGGSAGEETTGVEQDLLCVQPIKVPKSKGGKGGLKSPKSLEGPKF